MDDGKSEFTLTVKAHPSGQTYEVYPDDLTVLVVELKALVEFASDGVFPVERQNLVFKGHVLQDDRRLDSYGVHDKATLLVVKRKSLTPSSKPSAVHVQQTSSTPRAQAVSNPSSRPAAPAASPAAPFNPFAAFAAAPTGGAAMNASAPMNFEQMQRQFAAQMMQNPDLMSQLMDSPMMRSLADNPEIMSRMLESNPQIQALIERNPELGHALRDPNTLRQSMQMARNPEMMREMMRNQDRALRNISAHPGGMNALRRMYRDVQEPMMDAITSQHSSGPALHPTDDANDSPNAPSGPSPNASPLPNPWARPATAAPAALAATNPFAAMFGPPASQSTQNTTSTALNASAPALDLGGLGGLMGMGGLGPAGVPGGVPPEQLMSMLDNPMMQNAMQQLAQNPQLVQHMVQTHPMLRNNPMAAAMVQNPVFLQEMTNPNTLRNMLQLQRSFGGLGGMGVPSASGGAGTASAAPAVSATESKVSGDSQRQSSDDSSKPDVLYAEQLKEMVDMGFTDERANLAALVATGGNLQAAIERVLGMS